MARKWQILSSDWPALARKFIVLDLNKTSPLGLLGLAAVTVALGLTFWLTRERDERSRGTKV